MKAIAIVFIAAFLVACAETQTGAVTAPAGAEQTPEQVDPSPTEQNTVEVDLRMGNWFIEPNEIRVKQGDLVKVNIQVESGTHGFAVQGYNVNSGPLSEGESKTVEFTADQPGTFMLFCNVPCGTGHRDMRGQLIVE